MRVRGLVLSFVLSSYAWAGADFRAVRWPDVRVEAKSPEVIRALGTAQRLAYAQMQAKACELRLIAGEAPFVRDFLIADQALLLFEQVRQQFAELSPLKHHWGDVYVSFFGVKNWEPSAKTVTDKLEAFACESAEAAVHAFYTDRFEYLPVQPLLLQHVTGKSLWLLSHFTRLYTAIGRINDRWIEQPRPLSTGKAEEIAAKAVDELSSQYPQMILGSGSYFLSDSEAYNSVTGFKGLRPPMSFAAASEALTKAHLPGAILEVLEFYVEEARHLGLKHVHAAFPVAIDLWEQYKASLNER